MIAKYLNSFGETVKNYDTNHAQTLDNVLHEYNLDLDMWKMLQTVKEVRVTKRRHAEEFIKRIYPEEEYDRIYRKMDTIY